MKKGYLLVVLILGSYISTQAQNHNVKLNILGLGWGNVGLNYELIASKAISVQASGALFIPRSIRNTYDFSTDAPDITFQKKHQMGYSVSLEGRLYTKQNAPHGFYLGPFIRYYNYWAEADYSYISSDGTNTAINEDYKFGFNSFSGGIQMGAQWLIKDVITIDLSFAGMGISNVEMYGAFHSDNPNFSSNESVQKIKDLIFVSNKIGIKDTSTGYDLKHSYYTVAWRSSFKIGYYF